MVRSGANGPGMLLGGVVWRELFVRALWRDKVDNQTLSGVCIPYPSRVTSILFICS